MTVVEKVDFYVSTFIFFLNRKKKHTQQNTIVYVYAPGDNVLIYVLLCGKKQTNMFFDKDVCISVIGCMYIYIWIYISMLMMISWGTFFSEVLSSCCVVLKGGIIHLMVRSL